MAANLYELFHRFYQLGLPAVLGPDGTAFYWALVQKSNELRDPSMFTFTNTEAQDRCGITHPQAFSRARQKVVRAGLVVHKPGNLQRTGVYSQLDLQLDPLTVAGRLGRMRSETSEAPVDNSDSNPQGVDNAEGYPQAKSQTDHTLLTLESQSTHTPLTDHSHSAHKVDAETASDVSISREDNTREEQSSGANVPPAAEHHVRAHVRALADKAWSQVIAQALQALPRQVSEAFRACTPVSMDMDSLTVAPPVDESQRARVKRNVIWLNDCLSRLTGAPMELILAPGDARAGPEGGAVP